MGSAGLSCLQENGDELFMKLPLQPLKFFLEFPYLFRDMHALHHGSVGSAQHHVWHVCVGGCVFVTFFALCNCVCLCVCLFLFVCVSVFVCVFM